MTDPQSLSVVWAEGLEPLTLPEEVCYRAIESYWAKHHHGITIRDLAAQLGYRSPGWTHELAGSLRAKGWIQTMTDRVPGARATLVPALRCVLYEGRPDSGSKS